MAWLGEPRGIFRLHDSDNYCGSYISTLDAAEILQVSQDVISTLPTEEIDSELYIDELEIHRSWSSGNLLSPHRPRIGNARRSFDELVVMKLLEINLPGCQIEYQVKFGRKYVDLKVNIESQTKMIEFVGPSHFIPQYNRVPVSPLIRKKEVEDYFGSECIIWPYWIQRCSKNVKAIFGDQGEGLASVWSTKAFFGNFIFPDSASIILELTDRFGAVKKDGIGYMYGCEHTNKPVHPIIANIKNGRITKDILIPSGSKVPEGFWLPKELHTLVL